MSEAKFTPGPWFVRVWEGEEWPERRISIGPEQEGVAYAVAVCPKHEGDCDMENASLIAAAPGMYGYIADMPCPNSCTPCRGKPYDSKDVYKGCPFCIQRHAILSKARGEQ